MKIADPGKTSPQVVTDLKRLLIFSDMTENTCGASSCTCNLCQRLAYAPHRFRVALPYKDVVFNRTLCMDLMYLNSAAVLHIFHKDTKLSAAGFLRNETTEEI